MTQRAALNRATALGLCLTVVGSCLLLMMSNSFGVWAILGLIATIIISVWKLVIIAMGLMLVGIGVLWMIAPHRALDAIDRNSTPAREG